MYRKGKQGWMKHWDFILLDLILLQISFGIAYIMRSGWGNPYESMLYRNVALIILLLHFCAAFFMSSYSKVLKRGYWVEAKAVIKHVFLITAGSISYLFLLKESSSYSRLTMIYFALVASVVVFVGRTLLKLVLKNHIVPETRRRGIVLVGNASNYRKLTDDFLNNAYSEFRVIAVVLGDLTQQKDDTYREIPVLTNEEDVWHCLKTDGVDEILFSVKHENDFVDEMIDKSKEMGITTHIKLAKLENEHVNQMVETIEGYTVLSTSVSIATPGQLFVKRFMDILGGVFGLILTGIIFIFVAPLIYIQSPGPIFFKQIRIGKGGRKFTIYKFRSMYMDAEERKKELMEQNNIKDGHMFKMDNDPRIIKGIGHFIRNYSLDEFPQFWNVLKGDMSLVGTRPPTVDEWEKYELHHRKRLATKPGITGLWQVSGRSEIEDFEEVVKLDTTYIREWDLGMDFRILLKTVQVVLKKEGAM